MEIITSRENAAFKELLKLTDKKFRRQFGLCIIEGEKVVKENAALAEKIFIRNKNRKAYCDTFKDAKNIVVLDDKLFDLVTDLETDQGILAVIKKPVPREVTFPYLVLDGIQDPGNTGTILRTAAAFGFNTVFCLDCADAWSPKVIRASSGVQLCLNIVECSGDEFARPPESYLIAADLQGENIQGFDTGGFKFGLVLGNEGHGLGLRMKDLIKRTVTIPIAPSVESLNVSVAGGILMYELKRGIK